MELIRKRYQEIYDIIYKVDNVELDALLPIRAKNRNFESVIDDIFKPQSVVLEIYENNHSVADVCETYDSVFDKFMVAES